MSVNVIDRLNEKKLAKKSETEAILEVIKRFSKDNSFCFDLDWTEKTLNGLLQKFSRDTINISVVAEVSSGKSTFLNALVFGNQVLESKIGETTAKVFHIKYGKDYSVDGKTMNTIDDLKEAISKQNTTNLKSINAEEDIKEIESNITLPNENLEKGIELYDTPGFGTVNEKVMTILLKDAISKSDGVILLLDISQGLKKNEKNFVKDMINKIPSNKRFIILNKYDSVIDEDDLALKTKEEIALEIESVIKSVKDNLRDLQEDKNENLEVFYLSAKKALIGKLKNTPKVLEESRFPLFENKFWDRMVSAKAEVFDDAILTLERTKDALINSLNYEKMSIEDSIKETESLLDAGIEVESKMSSIIRFQTIIQNSIAEIRLETQKSSTSNRSTLEVEIKSALKSNIKPQLDNIGFWDKLQFWKLKEKYEEAVKKGLSNSEKDFENIIQNFMEKSFQHLSRKEKASNKTIVSINASIQEINSINNKINLKLIEEIKFGFDIDSNGELKLTDGNSGYHAGDFLKDLGISVGVGGIALVGLEFGLARLLPLIAGPIGWVVSGILALFTLSKASDKNNEILEKIVEQSLPIILKELQSILSSIDSFVLQNISVLSQNLNLIDERIRNIKESLNNKNELESNKKALSQKISVLNKFITDIER
ncbi:dynamin family protein [Sulfurimonas sp. SAG-AH-194-C21]|nr:dynamin family protein [Sulfurimonas sp. SAG-AH-194-C21]MDF1882617.1 dynamin family protein [Sulfurimonas sp. SAG-AH-194-C21]